MQSSALDLHQVGTVRTDMVLLMGFGKRSWVLAIALCTTACSLNTAPEPIRQIQIQQNWTMQRGDRIADHQIVAGLGDISIQLDGAAAYAPFAGQVQLTSQDCVLFSSPDVPAYLFRLCGLDHPHFGSVQSGEAIGTGEYLHFAALRKQPDGSWTIVEPAKDILERILKPP
ncbi:MAG TPA: hypothetical protein V6C57_07755 [Coleofasciculaceae cyanobacterium]